MSNTEEALMEFVFQAYISGDPEQIKSADQILQDNGLKIVWNPYPLRVEPDGLEGD